MRVVIAEDSVLLREGLARLLADGGVEVVAQVGERFGMAIAMTSLAGSATVSSEVPHVAQKVSSSGRIAEPHDTHACALARRASVRLPQCAQNGSPASIVLPHQPQLTVSPSGMGA